MLYPMQHWDGLLYCVKLEPYLAMSRKGKVLATESELNFRMQQSGIVSNNSEKHAELINHQDVGRS